MKIQFTRNRYNNHKSCNNPKIFTSQFFRSQICHFLMIGFVDACCYKQKFHLLYSDMNFQSPITYKKYSLHIKTSCISCLLYHNCFLCSFNGPINRIPHRILDRMANVIMFYSCHTISHSCLRHFYRNDF